MSDSITTSEQRSETWHKVKNLLPLLHADTSHGILLGFLRVLEVAKAHDVGKGSKWLEQTCDYHCQHAVDHLDECLSHGPKAPSNDCDCKHLHHAGFRALAAIARSEMG